MKILEIREANIIASKAKSFQEQIMSKDKYQFIFSNKIEAIVFIILQRFCNAREKMLTNSLPHAAWVVFF